MYDILKDIAIYSTQGNVPNKIGAGAFKSWLVSIKIDAKAQGFKEIQIIGQRVMNSSSANPGNIIDRVFKLE